MACEKAMVKCNHPKATIRDKFKDSMRKRTVKPFIIVTSLSLISRQFSGTAAVRPHIVSILNAHGIAFEANFMTVLLGLIGIFGGVCVMSTVKVLGKRKIYLLSSIGSLLSCFGLSNVKFCFYALWCFICFRFLGIYGFLFFPPSCTSPNSNIDSNHIQELSGKWGYFLLGLFLINYFFFAYGFSTIPTNLLSEIYPYR